MAKLIPPSDIRRSPNHVFPGLPKPDNSVAIHTAIASTLMQIAWWSLEVERRLLALESWHEAPVGTQGGPDGARVH